MVKKWNDHFKTIMEIFLIMMMILLSASLFVLGQSNDPLPLTEKVAKYKKILNLTDEQTAKVRDIFLREREQAVEDRAMAKDNAVELLQNAYERRKNANKEIEALLEPGQMETFRDFVRMTPYDRDLFEFTEGLLLDDDQAFKLEGLLIDYYNEIKMFMRGGPGGPGGGEGPPDGEPGMEPGGGDMPMGKPRGGMKRFAMKRFESKKYWAIKKILRKEQEKLLRQLTKHRKKEMKKRLNKMKEHRKNIS